MKGSLLFVLAFSLLFGLIGIQESFADHQIQIQNPDCLELRTLQEKYSFQDVQNGIICYTLGEISIRLEKTSTGDTSIDIPRILLDSRDENCNDKPFTLQVREIRTNLKFDDLRTDIQKLEYNEITTNKIRSLTFHVPQSEIMKPVYDHFEELDMIKIEIYGNRVLDKSCKKQIQAEYSPLEQYKHGIFEFDIVCKNDLQLVFKKSDWSPACIRESNIEKLIKNGWARSEKFPIIFITDKDVYKIGEPTTITMKNIGVHNLRTPSIPVGFSIYDQHDNRICSWSGPFSAIGNFSPGSEVTKTFDHDLCFGDINKIEPRTYEIRADHFYAFRQGKMPTHTIQLIQQN